jgi:hypothetical protein
MAEPIENADPVKSPPSKKADNATVAQRVEEVLRIRLDGAEYHDILQYAAEKGWGINERQIRTYIQRADDLLVERQECSRKRTIARHVAQRQALYARCVNAADFRTALAILADLAKLRGIYPDQEMKELRQLAAAQGLRLEDLERRLRLAGLPAQDTPHNGQNPLTLEEARKIARDAAVEALATVKTDHVLVEPPLDDIIPTPDNAEGLPTD